MFDRVYRQRLEADLAQWEARGVIAPATVAAIRGALPPATPGLNIPVVIGIVGGLLIAAAFLAFVAAHWMEIARLSRMGILSAGIVASNGLGAWFARTERPILADLCASVGAVIFGAGIALVGQMYHLGDDFAGGMLLWAVGALGAAALTGSRGALAVALAAASIWTCLRIAEIQDGPHLPFVVFWLAAGALALIWNSRVAAHLVALAALPWWIATATQVILFDLAPFFILANGAALLLGGGMALTATPWQRARDAGGVLANYGAFLLAGVAAMEVIVANDMLRPGSDASLQPAWTIACGVAATIAAFAVGALRRQAGAAFAGAAMALMLVAAIVWPLRTLGEPLGEPWPGYAVVLGAMLCLVVSGMFDGSRARTVAGWLGIAGAIAGITWAVKGSLLRRSAFLAAAGVVAIAMAAALNRLLPRSET
ncbi:DUF2157 domain-containing protein [Bradyrhizobium guangdongense]|uniref:DUF2157 domain-containing protein n=1 Tax=Bradyrhizobium guangdongense TaxID=1325090 RepID=UPI00112EC9F9|nr:DUF2157 domain-containing protein [Bradyrhizobium guangdongense]TPQ39903.1 DUF2157 domain-containing protein [Bradyrhizobium guangdongense]